MNHREELRERYEDALFALLMDEIAEKEGALAREENERLKNDPSAAVPEDVDRRCLQTIRRHFAKQKARTAGRYTVKAVKYALLAAGLAATMFTIAFAASETVRANTMNLIVKVLDDRTVFEFRPETTANPAARFGAGWIPDGYELVDQYNDTVGSWFGAGFEYQNSDNDIISIDYSSAKGTSLSVDTENAEIDYVEIHGVKAMLITKGNTFQLVWATEDNIAFIIVYGEGASLEDVLHVADQLTY